jgi:hypothetical protein
MLNFNTKIALYGSTKNTNKKRLVMLKNIFGEFKNITNLKIIDARCNVSLLLLSYEKKLHLQLKR